MKRVLAALLAVCLAVAGLPLAAEAYNMGKVGCCQTINAGGNHSFAIKTDGTLWAWGNNSSGQLGNGTTTNCYTPVKVMDNVVAISAGDNHSLAIKTDGTLWAWGYNYYGQLGDGTTTDRYSPMKVMENVAAASAGMRHSLAVKTDGTLWAWGDNYSCQLGDGTTTDRYNPMKVMENVAAASAGRYHSLAVKTDGTLWAWGDNYWGQLGDGTSIKRHSPVKVMDNVATVSTNMMNENSFAIKTDGTLWAWGDNGNGALGDGTKTTRYTPVKVMDNAAATSGSSHSFAIKTDGSLWAWGYNYYGQLGDGTTTECHDPIKVMDNVVAVSAGYDHSLAIKTDGTLWAWGWNMYGQLGDGSTEGRSTPVKIMDGLRTDGGVDVPVTQNISGILRQSDGCKVLWQCSYQEGKDGQPQNGKLKIFTSATNGEKEELFLINDGVDTGLPYPWELEPYNLPESAITELTVAGESAKQLRVPSNAFRDYTNLKQAVLDGVSGIDSYAFSGCSSLANLAVNDALTSIGTGAFQNCPLGTVLMGQNLSSIADDAFTGCYKLKIRCYAGSYVHRYAESHNIPFELISEINPQVSVPFYIADKFITMKIDWDPSTMFAKDARQPSNELAVAGLVLSGAVEEGPDYIDKTFSSMGFGKHTNIGYEDLLTAGRPALSIGSRLVSVNGQSKTLITVAIRGTQLELRNILIGDLITDVFSVVDGFLASGNYVKDQVDGFIAKNHPGLKKEDTLLFITGHSLGGAAAGHLSRLCVQDGLVDVKNCFTYTYGCPKNYNIYDSYSDGVHNIINVDDVVPVIPPNYVIHIGKDYRYKSDGNDEFAETYKTLTGAYPGFMLPLDKHYVGTYMALLLSGTQFAASGDFNHRLVRILCPVDVEVFDSAGNIVGRVVDNQVDKTIVSDNVIVCVVDDHKYIYLFDDDAYTFKVTGTDSGTLEYGVQDYAADGSLLAEKEYANVVLENGKKLSSAVGGSTDTPDVKLLVLGANNQPQKEVLSDGTGTEIPIATTPSTPPTPTSRPGGGGGTISMYGITIQQTEHGTITADRSSTYSGAVVNLTAVPDDGYMLQELGVTDSQGRTVEVVEKSGKYIFRMPSRNVTVTAKFVSASTPAPTLTPTPTSTPTPMPTSTPTPIPPAWKNPFPDVQDNGWYREAVEFVCTKGLMSGYANGRFGPNDNLSRAQFAQILYNKEGKPEVTEGSRFEDVAKGLWYTAAINWAESAGVVSGYGNGLFGPGDNITREQLVTMLWRYVGSPQVSDAQMDFRDTDKISDYARTAMQWAVKNGIIKGKGEKILDPKGFAIRAEVAQMLMNYLSE